MRSFLFLASVLACSWCISTAKEYPFTNQYGEPVGICSSLSATHGCLGQDLSNPAFRRMITKSECKELGGLSWLDVCDNFECINLNEASADGDPHFKTWSGERYDYHGECDLVLVQSKQFGNGLGLDAHVRTKRKSFFSYMVGIALRIGNDVLEVTKDGTYYLNGNKGSVVFGKKDLQDEEKETVGGFALSHRVVKRNLRFFTIDLNGEDQITIKNHRGYLAIKVNAVRADDFGDSVGLLGSFSTGNMMARNGTIITSGHDFGPEWQVRDTEPMLFQVARYPQYPQECLNPKVTAATAKRRLSGESNNSKLRRALAEKACEKVNNGDRPACVFDVMATGDLELAIASFNFDF